MPLSRVVHRIVLLLKIYSVHSDVSVFSVAVIGAEIPLLALLLPKGRSFFGNHSERGAV